MGRIALRKKHSESTAVSNIFIDEYMTDANEAQIKVYLYLLRCLEDELPVSVTLIADRFDYVEKDVLRALVYWERRGILSIEYDSGQNIVGICLGKCTHVEEQKTPEIRLSGSQQAPAQTATAPGAPVAARQDMPAKPFYSLEQMNSFKNQEDIKQLTYMTQQYMGRPLSSSDVNTLLYMYDGLHFPVELMEYAIEYCVNAGHKSMRYIEKVAISWAEQGIETVEEAKAQGSSGKYRREAFMVLKAFGITGRSIVESDIAFTTRWMEEYGFEMDVILEACKRTLLAISKPSFNYADVILKRWKDEGIHHVSDIPASDEKFKKESTVTPRPARRTTGFSNFTQRDVDYNSIAENIMESQAPISNTQ